jgi:hypothetical protein
MPRAPAVEDADGDGAVNFNKSQLWSYLVMAEVTVYGFPISTFVNIVRLILTHKNVTFDFHDLEPEMGGPSHLSLHPFNRVPILDHAGFRIYETSAIALYVDDAFDGPALQPRICVRAQKCINGSVW